ncbi:hypothetical protein [Pseudomonas sp. CGJS7]|uniref:hypothetical protein n=1 Tax=Pseudomonas sp. CGJS7 TaxID=3109348 RepID=UPI003008ACCA
MSTVDPAVARRRQQLQSGPTRVAHLRLWSFIAVYAGLWAMLGYGIADTMAAGLSSAYSRSAAQAPGETSPLFWMLMVGGIGGGILSLLITAVLDRVYGMAAGTRATFAINLGAIALGFWRGASDRWPPPQRVGFSDLPGANAQPWDAATWIGWTSQYWAPLLLLAIAAALTVGAVRAYRKQRLREQRIQRVLSQGIRVAGTITELHSTGVEIYNQPRIRLVVKFVDHVGTERWVTKTELFDPLALPRVGDGAHVWFHPDSPGEQDLIAVGFGSEDDAQLAETSAGRRGSGS